MKPSAVPGTYFLPKAVSRHGAVQVMGLTKKMGTVKYYRACSTRSTCLFVFVIYMYRHIPEIYIYIYTWSVHRYIGDGNVTPGALYSRCGDKLPGNRVKSRFLCCCAIVNGLNPFELQSRFGDKVLKFQVVCSQLSPKRGCSAKRHPRAQVSSSV